MKGFSIVVCLLLVGCGNNSTLSDGLEATGSIVDVDLTDSSPITDVGVADLDGLDIGTNSDATPDIEALDSSCENISFLGVANQFNATVEMVQTEDGFVVLWESANVLEIRILDKQGTVLSGRQITRQRWSDDQPPQLFALEDSFLVLYKNEEEIRFQSSYSSGWAGRSNNFRGTPYLPEEGWFPIIVQVENRWMRLGPNGAREVELEVGEEASALSWNGSSLISAEANPDDSGKWRSTVLEGRSEFVHEWRQNESPYAELRYSKNAKESGRHAALLGTTVLIEGAEPLRLEGVLSTRANAMATTIGNISWNGESYSVLLLGVDAPGEKANGYFFEVDENGIQIGESKKLFSTKSVQHSREKLAVPALIASSPNQVATAWIESGSQVFFGCFSTLDN